MIIVTPSKRSQITLANKLRLRLKMYSMPFEQALVSKPGLIKSKQEAGPDIFKLTSKPRKPISNSDATFTSRIAALALSKSALKQWLRPRSGLAERETTVTIPGHLSK